MESYHTRQSNCEGPVTDHGPAPFTANISYAAQQNQNFRTAFWTGQHLQMTLMSISPRCEIGLEMHPETDQLIRVECGRALVCIGTRKENLDLQCCLNAGDAVFVPAGAWHNIFNTGNCPLKLSSVYAPPRHPYGTVQNEKKRGTAKEN